WPGDCTLHIAHCSFRFMVSTRVQILGSGQLVNLPGSAGIPVAELLIAFTPARMLALPGPTAATHVRIDECGPIGPSICRGGCTNGHKFASISDATFSPLPVSLA